MLGGVIGGVCSGVSSFKRGFVKKHVNLELWRVRNNVTTSQLFTYTLNTWAKCGLKSYLCRFMVKWVEKMEPVSCCDLLSLELWLQWWAESLQLAEPLLLLAMWEKTIQAFWKKHGPCFGNNLHPQPASTTSFLATKRLQDQGTFSKASIALSRVV